MPRQLAFRKFLRQQAIRKWQTQARHLYHFKQHIRK